MNSEETKMVDHVITQADLDNDPKLAEAGKGLGDVIQVPEVATAPVAVEDVKNEDGSVTHVVTEQDHTDGKFLDAPVASTVTFTPEVAPVVTPEGSDKVEKTPEELAAEAEASKEAVAPVDVAPVRRYQGEVIISDGFRTLNDGSQTRHIRNAKGVEFDLTEAEYELITVDAQ